MTCPPQKSKQGQGGLLVELNGAVAIVTGAARGIGRGIAACLAREGVHVVIADLGQNQDIAQEMEETARQVRAHGVEALTVNVDVRDWEQVQGMVKAAIDRFGRVDILVNDAGVISVAAVATMEESEWDRVLDVNLKGTFLCCKAVAPHMMERRSGRIVNLSSQAGKRGYPGNAHYSASKFGIIGLTQSLAHEMGPSNVTVNAVCPGEVNTAMFRDVVAPAIAFLSGTTPEQVWEEWIRTRVPLGRPQTPEDIGEAVVFLCRAENITGEALNVTGGSEMA
jgi:meso-butanediol dehydrogenase/(S,S)-butanediol dehydrogenase/diacetyl reductase